MLIAPSATALGLGRLSVKSALGESLRAEIEVTAMTPEEAANLRIRVAPPESYRAANVDYNPVLPSTKAVLERRPDGRQFVRLTSDRGVQEPFVDVILEISWATGRLVREYTLLFDPPVTARATPAPATAPTAQAPANTAPMVSTAPTAPPPARASNASPAAVARAERAERVERALAAARAERAERNAERNAARQAAAQSSVAAPRPSAPGAQGDEYRVKAGDSLSKIAATTQRPGISLDQMLVALFRANPQAFMDNNMNRLKAGVVLAVPPTESAQAVSPSEARQVITAQSADFGAYRQRLAGNVSDAKAEGSARQASGKVQASVDDRKQAAATTPDKLTLSKGATANPAQEDRISRERERAASDARLAEIAKNVDQLKKLQGAASAPAGATAAGPGAPVVAARPSTTVAAPPVVVAQAPAPAPAPPAAATPAPAPAPVTPAVTAPAAATVPAPAVVAPPVTATASSATTAPTPPARPPASAVAAAKTAPRPAGKAPVEEPGMLGTLMEDNPLVLGIGGLLVALLAGFGLYRFAKRSKKDSGETSFLESRLQPDSFFGASGGQRIDTRDAGGTSSSMTYSLSQLDAIGDVDPVAEADVYLAYGRDLQAEEILKEAMRSSPERLAIRTKLLEVYAKRRDTKGFELLATQLYALTRGEGEDWAKAQQLGAEIDPDNPLFHPGGAPSEIVRDGGEIAEPLGASTLPQSVVPVPSQFGHSLPAPAPTDSAFGELDLDLDNPEIGKPTAPGALDEAVTFSEAPHVELDPDPAPDDFASSTHKMPLVRNEAEVPADKRDEPLPFDMSGFSLDLDKPGTDVAETRADTAAADLELPSLEAEDQDPMVRKLELAEEFRQIGDKDGARDLLREVLAKASGATRSKAQGMLDDLG